VPNFAVERLGSTLFLFVSGVASGMISWNVLNMLAATRQDARLQPLASCVTCTAGNRVCLSTNHRDGPGVMGYG